MNREPTNQLLYKAYLTLKTYSLFAQNSNFTEHLVFQSAKSNLFKSPSFHSQKCPSFFQRLILWPMVLIFLFITFSSSFYTSLPFYFQTCSGHPHYAINGPNSLSLHEPPCLLPCHSEISRRRWILFPYPLQLGLAIWSALASRMRQKCLCVYLQFSFCLSS